MSRRDLHRKSSRKDGSWRGKAGRGRLATAAAVLLALAGWALPQTAAAQVRFSRTPLAHEPWTPCPPASTAHQAECGVIEEPTPVSPARASALELEGGGRNGALDPEDLRSAYELPEKGGAGHTVAIVDAYNDPDANADLKTYRKTYGLPECSEENGCFAKVNQKGETANYPENEESWASEISLDLDMASAACQECHILLVEANNAGGNNLGAADEEAAKLGATTISNSWYDGGESSEDASYNHYFDHPGIPTLFASGDKNYKASYPATSPYVIAVGGTRLKKAPASPRGWSEEVWHELWAEVPGAWIGTGSGCSAYEEKPSWQKDAACSKRMTNDVAADASLKSPVSVYDSFGKGEHWHDSGGTSVATPLIAGIEALSGKPILEQGPEAFYTHPSQLFDVTEGTDANPTEPCTPPAEDAYFCTAEIGYDGPTGNGTPDGPFEGPSWALQSAPLPAGASEGALEAVSCASATACTSVGGSKSGQGVSMTLAEHWNGSSWETQETGASDSTFAGVSCATTTECVASGVYQGSEGARPLVEQWTGGIWQHLETILPTGAKSGELTGVSCTSAKACTAVGSYQPGEGASAALAERWNGKAWAAQTVPSPSGASESGLSGISCASTKACTADGWYLDAEGAKLALAEAWNGTTWTVQTVPTPNGARESALSGSSCTSTKACMADGWYLDAEGAKLALAEAWNGTSWEAQTPPSPEGAKASVLSAVSCASSTVCAATGSYENGAGAWVSLAEHWDDDIWQVRNAPNPSGAASSRLAGIACSTEAEACTATGAYKNNEGVQLPEAQGW
jgi:hypothetical protein